MAAQPPPGRLKTALRHAPALLGVALLFGAIYVLQHEFRNLHIADIAGALRAIPTRARLVAFAWTLLAYFILTFYDRLGTIYAGHKVSYGRVSFASFCAYTLAHNIGFAAVSGAAVRYRLYAHWGLSPLQIGKVIAFCSLTFGLGALVLGGSILVIEPHAVPFFGEHLPALAMRAIGIAMWAVVAGYVTLSRVLGAVRAFGSTIELPGWRMAILQVLLATADVAVTAAIFYALLPDAAGLSFGRFVGVYLASYSAGLLATVPGGLGVFDTAMLLGLSPYLPAPQVVGAIVVFRLYYYVIPLFLAGTLFAGNELLLRGRGVMKTTAELPGVQAIGRWSEPDFVAAAATGVVALCGALLLAQGVLASELAARRSGMELVLVDVVSQASEFVPSLIGAALMVMAVGLAQRVKLAWTGAIVLLLAGAAFTLAAQGLVWAPFVLVLGAVVLAPFHRYFYRHASLLRGRLDAATALPLLTLAGCVLALTSLEPHLRWLDSNSWWEVVLSPDMPNALRASVALTVGLAAIALWRLLRPGRVSSEAWTSDTRASYAALGAPPPVRADGMVWGEAARAGVAFRRLGRVLLALGDPVGAESDRISTIWRLRDLAHQEGLDPAVWRAGPGLLGVYADLGLSALPIAADGMSLAGDERAGRADSFLVCIAERDLPALLPLLSGLDE